jgi:hypothetical protein
MPLSDRITQFLQQLGQGYDLGVMSPEEREQRRQFQANAARQQEQFGTHQDYLNRQLQQQAEEAQARIDAGLLPYGYGRVGAGPATQQGGPGLTDPTPHIGEQPGQGTPRIPPESQPFDISSIMPLVSMFGQQQQSGLSMNAPGQQPGGMPTAASRMAPTGGASGGGGVASPAISTVFNIGKGQYQKLSGSDETTSVDIPEKFRGLFGGQAKVDFKDPAMARQIQSEFIKDVMAGGKPAKEPNKEADLMKSAAQLTADAHKLKGTFNSINDLPLEHQAEAWNQHADLLGGEVAKAAKEARTQNQLDRSEKFRTEKASDQEALNMIKQDPFAWFDKSIIPDQKARLRLLAKDQGVTLPSRAPKEGMDKKIEIANEIQEQVQRMKAIAEALGPESFGAMIGRMKNAEGDWASPVFTDPMRAQLEQEFRGHSKFLTLQEVSLFGGGRTAVQLFNEAKSVTPQQKQDMNFLTGSFRSTFNRAQMSKDAVRRYIYGIDEPVGTGRKKGDVVLIKGIPHRLTSDRDKSGNFTAEPVR